MDDRRCPPHSLTRQTEVPIRDFYDPPHPRRGTRTRLPPRRRTRPNPFRTRVRPQALTFSSPSTRLSPKLPHAPPHPRSFHPCRYLGLGSRSGTPSIRNPSRHRCRRLNSLTSKISFGCSSSRPDHCRGWSRLLFRNPRSYRLCPRNSHSLVLPCPPHPQHPCDRPAIP